MDGERGAFLAIPDNVADLYRLLETRWDAFVFGGVAFERLSPRARYGILSQVSTVSSSASLSGKSQ